MKDIIESSLQNSLSYDDFRILVSDLLAKGKATGENQTEAYVNYSKLGNARMKRLDKTFHLSEKGKKRMQESTKEYTWLVLTEGWCGDAAHALPILNKMAEFSENIDLKIVLRDENEALMNQFLTNGSKSIPKLIAIDKATHKVIDTWGPRPSIATKLVNDYKEANGGLDPEFKEELQVWYNKNKGENIEQDMLALLNGS
jgi:hypothetical protein